MADGMKLVPPDITFGAAPIDVTPRTCGVVHIYISPNGVFCIVFELSREVELSRFERIEGLAVTVPVSRWRGWISNCH